MARFVWQREHQGAIVTQVTADGQGAWCASAYLRQNPTRVVRTPKIFVSLSDALRQADVLVEQTFDHVCSSECCGEWQAVDRQNVNTDCRVRDETA